jgi:hypothetical protein
VITEVEVEKALDWMRDNAEKAANAKAERIYMEQYLKTVEADLCAEKAHVSVKAQENYARSHSTYKQQLQAIKEAVQQEEALRWLMIAAQAKVEVWRSQSANNRGMDRATR